MSQENGQSKQRVIILGGGFGGIYTALHLERALKDQPEIEILLVNQENFLLFTPMLHEIAASDLDPTDIVNPIHKLLKRTRFFCGSVDAIDLNGQTVTVSHGDTYHSHTIPYTHLVLALGAVSHFHGLPGLAENALTMKSLGDAIHLRNQMIASLEEADFECAKEARERLLTIVVAGGGFAGVETVAAVHDFIHGVLHFYKNLTPKNIRVVLVHSGKVLLPELDGSLGRYAGELMQKRGVEIRFGTRVQRYVDGIAQFSDGTSLQTCALVWTAGSAPNPILSTLSCAKEKGRVLVTESLQLTERKNVWALGDCAAIPTGSGTFHPPTAQHAIREAAVVATNITNSFAGKPLKTFRFRTLGQLASLGHRKGVAQVFGFRFSGFVAWWLWRTVYLMKLPRWEKRIRVALNWTLDVLFSKDTVQLPAVRSRIMRVPMTSDYHGTAMADIPGSALPKEDRRDEPGQVVTH